MRGAAWTEEEWKAIEDDQNGDRVGSRRRRQPAVWIPARLLATELQIHHIHGLLGEADFLSDDADATAYGPPEAEFEKACRIAERRIKIVDEEIEQAVVEDAEAALQQAVFVYFIGFGFDERNLGKIHVPACLTDTTVVQGTAYDFTPIEQSHVMRAFGGGRINLYPEDALTFLRTRAEPLFD